VSKAKPKHKQRCDWCRRFFADTRFTLPRKADDLEMCSYECVKQFWEEARVSAMLDDE
jgi:hypothetical protein